MSDRALAVGSRRREVSAAWRAEVEQDALTLAGFIQWDKVQEVARRNPALPAFYATYVFDQAAREAFHRWCGPPLLALEVDALVIKVVEIESSAPKYLQLPAVLASFTDDAQFLAGRPAGRLLYRESMYQEVITEIDREQLAQAIAQRGREAVMKELEEGEGDWYRLEYAPVRFSQQEVFDVIDSTVRGPDRWQALHTSLAWRVGFAVGFLSSLFIPQPDEARNGMVILSGLVAPLLPQSVAQAGKSSRRIAPAKDKRSRSRSSRKRS